MSLSKSPDGSNHIQLYLILLQHMHNLQRALVFQRRLKALQNNVVKNVFSGASSINMRPGKKKSPTTEETLKLKTFFFYFR